MHQQPEAAKLIKQASHLLRSGRFGGHQVNKHGRVDTSIPMHNPDRTLYAWFIPVTIGDRIAGFFLFSADGTFLQYSSFQRHEGELDGCPSAAAWSDQSLILQAAKKEMLADEQVQNVYLSYDGIPSHIAWAVDTELPNGQMRTIYIAGNSVWSIRRQR